MQVKPVGETLEARVTVPVKPLIGAVVIVEMPVARARTVTLEGLTVTEKSAGAVTVTVTAAECESNPPVAVIVTV